MKLGFSLSLMAYKAVSSLRCIWGVHIVLLRCVHPNLHAGAFRLPQKIIQSPYARKRGTSQRTIY